MLKVLTALTMAIFVSGIAIAQEPNIDFEMKPRPTDESDQEICRTGLTGSRCHGR
jgi:hypothetical protein